MGRDLEIGILDRHFKNPGKDPDKPFTSDLLIGSHT